MEKEHSGTEAYGGPGMLFRKAEESHRVLFLLFVVGSELGDGGTEQHAVLVARIFGGSRHMSQKALCFGPGKGEHDECVEANTMCLD